MLACPELLELAVNALIAVSVALLVLGPASLLTTSRALRPSFIAAMPLWYFLIPYTIARGYAVYEDWPCGRAIAAAAFTNIIFFAIYFGLIAVLVISAR